MGYDVREIIAEDETLRNVFQAVDYEIILTEFNEEDIEAVVSFTLKFPFYSTTEEMKLVKIGDEWLVDL